MIEAKTIGGPINHGVKHRGGSHLYLLHSPPIDVHIKTWNVRLGETIEGV